MEELKNVLLFLAKNRNVNDSFIERLEKVGIVVEYGNFEYWNSCPFVKIGNKKIFLVTSKTYNNNIHCANRKQVNIINDIILAIKEQKENLEKEDKTIEDFFKKLSE